MNIGTTIKLDTSASPGTTTYPASPEQITQNFASALPLVFVRLKGDGASLMSETKVKLYVMDGATNRLSDLASVTPKKAHMHVRGHATAQGPKFQFSVKLKGEPSTPFMSMPFGGKHWVFNDAGLVDWTYLRNVTAFKMESALGDWAPRTKFFEMFICPDDKTVSIADIMAEPYKYYQGLYVLMEKIRVRKTRVDVPKYSSTDPAPPLVGGFIVQLNAQSDKYLSLNPSSYPNIPNENPLPSPPPMPRLGVGQVILYDPKENYFQDTSPYTTQEYDIYNWWNNWINNFVFPNDVPGNGFPAVGFADTTLVNGVALIDVIADSTDLESFARYFLLNEIAKDPDGYHRSTYMYKEPDTATSVGKLYAGPLWDKNKSYGNVEQYPSGTSYQWYTSTEHWGYNPPATLNPAQAPEWWLVLLSSKKFCAILLKVWQDNYKTNGAFDYDTIAANIANFVSELSGSGVAGQGAAFSVSSVSGGAITALSIESKGSGYSMDDAIEISSVTKPEYKASITVTAVDEHGAITTVSIKKGGSGFTTATKLKISNNIPINAVYRDLSVWKPGETIDNWQSWVTNLRSYLKARVKWIDSNLSALVKATSGLAGN